MAKVIESGEIRMAVQAHYAARASDSCCGPETGFYSEDDLLEMPEDISAFSLGCGNAVAAADLQPGETVLDLGSGGGLECFLAARQVGEAGWVIGVDMTPEMLAKARAAAVRLGLPQVEFREGLIESLPVADSEIDIIISNCVVNLSPDKTAVMREMFRVLKPGGRLAISDVVTQAEVPGEARADMALWSACASGALSVQAWKAGLREAGFRNVRLEANGGEQDWESLLPKSRPFSALIFAEKP